MNSAAITPPVEQCKECTKRQEQYNYKYVYGENLKLKRTFLFVGEAPGRVENEQGKVFVGKSGQLLRDSLANLNFPKNQCAFTNAVHVRPDEYNSTPSFSWGQDCLNICKPKLLDIVDPALIICLGNTAWKQFTRNSSASVFKDRRRVLSYKHTYAPDSAGRVYTREIPIVCTWHPAYILRMEGREKEWWEADLDSYVLGEWDRRELVPNLTVRKIFPKELNKSTYFCLDVETTGLHPWRGDTLRCVGITGNPTYHTNESQRVYVIKDEKGFAAIQRKVYKKPKDPGEILYIEGANTHFDLMWFLKPGKFPYCRTRDIQFKHYLVDEEYPIRRLDHLALLYTPYKEWKLPEHGANETNLAKLYEYNARDVLQTQLISKEIGAQETIDIAQAEPVSKVMERVQPILAAMTRTGIRVDPAELQGVDEACKEIIATKLWSLNLIHLNYATITTKTNAGGTFSGIAPGKITEKCLNTPTRVSKIIFQDLYAIPPEGNQYLMKSGLPRTDTKTLRATNDTTGFVIELEKYKRERDNYRKYVTNLYDYIDQDPDWGEQLSDDPVWTMHPTVNIASGWTSRSKSKTGGTTSSRFSYKNPPLHNIPRGHPIRRIFIPHKQAGHRYLAQTDMKQAELRCLAQESKDPQLIEAIKIHEDLHLSLADKLQEQGIHLGTDPRNVAKTINFAILYGVSAKGLADQTPLSVDEAKLAIKLWFERFKRVKFLWYKTRQDILNRGYVQTSFGLKRRFRTGLNKFDPILFKSQRQGFNHLFQSAAHQINLLILLAIQDATNNFKHHWPLGLIHDAILFSTPDAEDLKGRIQLAYDILGENYLPDFFGQDMIIPIEGDYKSGPNWYDMAGDKTTFTTKSVTK